MPAAARRLLGIQRWRTPRLVLTETRPSGEPVDSHRWISAIDRAVGGGGGSRVIAWTPDGRIITEAEDQLFLSQPDGHDRRPLVTVGKNKHPAICQGGRYVLFKSDRSTIGEIWRVSLDGGDPVRVPGAALYGGPHCAPDASWFVTAALTHGGWPALFRVDLTRGQPVQLTQTLAEAPAVSRDGNRIAYFAGGPNSSQWVTEVLALMASSGGSATRRYALPAGVDTLVQPRWTPDGAGVAYAAYKGGSANIFVQPVSGGSPVQLTHLLATRIFAFDWSFDGRRLAVSAGEEPNDMVLIEDLQEKQ
jgi:Tol biopolymer transport system component